MSARMNKHGKVVVETPQKAQPVFVPVKRESRLVIGRRGIEILYQNGIQRRMVFHTPVAAAIHAERIGD